MTREKATGTDVARTAGDWNVSFCMSSNLSAFFKKLSSINRACLVSGTLSVSYFGGVC